MKKTGLIILLALCCQAAQEQNVLRDTVKNDVKRDSLPEIVITSTRTGQAIRNLPTRVETISGEELEEKGNMKPGDIRMMLNESTGIQAQQTSATSYNSTVRIQGLDGKYTQILRDGFPLYAGFSGGLGLLQVAPLDLKQVEVIKGASSTLYGGGAIAGLVNLVSKTPTDRKELSFVVNGTSALGLDASGFFSERNKSVGTTMFASYNHGTPFDPSGIGFTAIPKFDRFTFNPKLFLYWGDKTTLTLGVNATTENRLGGDIRYVRREGDSTHSYYEKDLTRRVSTQTDLEHTLNSSSGFSVKNSVSYYDRSIQIPTYIFSGIQWSSFTEWSYHYRTDRTQWIAGINFLTDRFNQDQVGDHIPLNYSQNTVGAFVQNTWKVSGRVILETGVREDRQNDYGSFFLPRLSALFKLSPQLTSRIGGGLGYKTPNVFTDTAEEIQFKNLLPINPRATTAERSYGVNADLNFHTRLLDGQMEVSINQLVFYTRIHDPLLLTALSNGYYQYQQPAGYVDTKGLETNIRVSYSGFELHVGYTLADVLQHYGTVTEYPLVARNRVNNTLMYEIEDKLKVGLEAYYYDPQRLSDGTTGRDYWLCGMMAEKMWGHFSVFVNVEDLLDVRQTKFGSIYTGPITNPVFKDIYAPLDGRVVNGGIKWRL